MQPVSTKGTTHLNFVITSMHSSQYSLLIHYPLFAPDHWHVTLTRAVFINPSASLIDPVQACHDSSPEARAFQPHTQPLPHTPMHATWSHQFQFGTTISEVHTALSTLMVKATALTDQIQCPGLHSTLSLHSGPVRAHTHLPSLFIMFLPSSKHTLEIPHTSWAVRQFMTFAPFPESPWFYNESTRYC